MRPWAAVLVAMGGVGAMAAAQGPAPARPNLLLVTIDTLRADRVGAYGYKLGATPVMDRLAREGVRLADAVVHVPQTRPSHASFFTGRLPYEHGLRDNASAALPRSTATLASVLRGQGYDTGGFIAAYPVSRASGLDQGFDNFDDPFGAFEATTTRAARVERPAREVVDRALAWLDRPRSAPFFAWVHLFDPHAPYAAPAPYRTRFAARPYDGEVAYADAQLGRLVDWLDRAGLRGRTAVVVTSDHGEGLGEHGEDEHMLFVYDSTLRVPLLMSWPGRLPSGAVVGGQFRGVDLMATVLDLLGVTAPATSGASRAGQLLSGSRLPDNECYAESLYGSLHFGWAPLRALRAEGWKYVDAPRAELYRLTEDPAELKNLLDTRGSVASAIKARLVSYDQVGTPAAGAGDLDPSAAARLAALGYVGGSFFRGGTPSGADPKDKVRGFEVYRKQMTRGIALYRAGDLDGAIRVLQALRQGPETSFNVEYYLGRSLLEKGRAAEAVAPLQRALEAAPTAGPAQVSLVEALMAAGRADEARPVLDKALAASPANAELHLLRGRQLLAADDAGGARLALEKAREMAPRDAVTRALLSNAYRNLGLADAALDEAEEAVRLDAGVADAQVALGLALGAKGREAEAATRLREAVRLQPRNADALFYLGAIELRAGRPAAALPLLERLVSVAPRYPGASQALAAARRSAQPPR
jgi:arylsulfatase A-like enzyme/Flp pilus assembly protein TadD